MALNKKISKAEFDAMQDGALKNFYIDKGDHFILDVGDDDSGALLRAKERETERRKEVEKELKELRSKIEGLDFESRRKLDDITSLEKSWNEKHTKTVTELTDKYTNLQKAVRKNLIESTAISLASEISTVPALMKKVLMDRFEVEFNEAGPSIKVLDEKGALSAATIEDLKKEIVANKEFSSIIQGSKASGGGRATPNRISDPSLNQTDKPMADMNPRALAEIIKSKIEQRG